MRSRDKIAIALFSITLGLGALIFWQSSSNDTELRRFRWFAAKAPMRLMTDEIFTAENAPSLWFGGLSLGGMILLGLILKAINGAEIRAFRDRLIQMEVAKAEVETLLQDAVWKEKHARDAKETAVKELEGNLNRIYDLENQLRETEQLLWTREKEFKALSSQGSAGTEPARGAGAAKAARDKALQEEIKKNAELLQAKDVAMQQLESRLSRKIRSLEHELGDQVKLLREREEDLEDLGTQLAEKSAAQSRAESLLEEELNRGKQSLQAKESAISDLGKRLKGEIDALQSQLSEKRSLLQNQSTEAAELKAQVNALTARLADAASAKERVESQRLEELKKQTQALQAKDAAIKKLEERAQGTLHDFEARLAEKEKLSKDQDAELLALRSRVHELSRTGSAKEQSQSLLQQELKSQAEALRSRDAAIKEKEKKLDGKIQALEFQLTEKEALLQSRSTELAGLKGEVDVVTRRLADAASAKERAENLLQQELKKRSELLRSKDSALQEAENNLLAKVRALESQLGERDAFLRERDTQMQDLRAQLTKMSSMNEEARRLLADELKKLRPALERKDAAIKALEEKWTTTVRPLEERVDGQETLLNQRAAQIEALRSELDTLKTQLTETSASAEPAEGAQVPRTKEFEESVKRIHTLERSLRETGDLMKTRDEKIERLEAELKEKRTELAKHEIEVWQAVERRSQWKRRLSKFGIPIKD
jgi:chromosome segregation ATPase